MAQGPNNDHVNPDQRAVDRQVRALEALQNPNHKRRLEDELLERRPIPTEAIPGFRRVGVERTAKLSGDGRNLLVVDHEIIASVDDEELLLSRDHEKVENLCCGLARYRVPDNVEVATSVAALRAQGVLASANHAVFLGNTAKGGDSPDATLNPLEAMDEEGGQAETALVIVIDNGLDRAGPGRGDEWLKDVTTPEETDHDPLDEVDARGQVSSDGLLDLAAGHGTFVAGTIRRVEPGANVIVLRALDTEGIGGEDMIASAICRAAEIFTREEYNGRGVLNLSLGIETIDDLSPIAIECALRELPPGVVVVAAAGNEPQRRPLWPAASKRAVAVAGLCDDLSPSSWSNRGAFVDFSTRAEGIVSTFVDGEETPRPTQPPPTTFPANSQDWSYAAWTGTSFATPQVAARIARYIAELSQDAPVELAVQRLRDEGTYLPAWGYVVDILPAADPPLRCSTERRRVLF